MSVKKGESQYGKCVLMPMFILRIIARNAKARIASGEDVTTVINSYTKLSDTDKETVKQLIHSLPM